MWWAFTYACKTDACVCICAWAWGKGGALHFFILSFILFNFFYTVPLILFNHLYWYHKGWTTSLVIAWAMAGPLYKEIWSVLDTRISPLASKASGLVWSDPHDMTDQIWLCQYLVNNYTWETPTLHLHLVMGARRLFSWWVSDRNGQWFFFLFACWQPSFIVIYLALHHWMTWLKMYLHHGTLGF